MLARPLRKSVVRRQRSLSDTRCRRRRCRRQHWRRNRCRAMSIPRRQPPKRASRRRQRRSSSTSPGTRYPNKSPSHLWRGRRDCNQHARFTEREKPVEASAGTRAPRALELPIWCAAILHWRDQRIDHRPLAVSRIIWTAHPSTVGAIPVFVALHGRTPVE